MRRAFRILAALAFLIGLCCSQGHAAVTLDNCEAGFFALPSGSTQTDNGFTVGAGSNQVLVLLVSQGNSSGNITATWNGVSLSAVTGASNTVGAIRTDVLVLKAPAQGNHALVINTSTAFSFSDAITCAFNGVDQTTPAINGTSASSNTVNVTSATADAVVATFASTVSVTATNNTQLYATGGTGTGAGYALPGSATVTMTATVGGGNNTVSAADLLAASGGGGATCIKGSLALMGAGC